MELRTASRTLNFTTLPFDQGFHIGVNLGDVHFNGVHAVCIHVTVSRVIQPSCNLDIPLDLADRVEQAIRMHWKKPLYLANQDLSRL